MDDECTFILKSPQLPIVEYLLSFAKLSKYGNDSVNDNPMKWKVVRIR